MAEKDKYVNDTIAEKERYIAETIEQKDREIQNLTSKLQDIPLHDEVVGFCEYGVGVETTKEHEGIYQISYIATELKVRGNISETRCSPR